MSKEDAAAQCIKEFNVDWVTGSDFREAVTALKEFGGVSDNSCHRLSHRE